jgi:hypothetical protein
MPQKQIPTIGDPNWGTPVLLVVTQQMLPILVEFMDRT